MKNFQLFLANLPKDQKDFLVLLEQTAKVHGEARNPMGKENVCIWDDEFFHLKETSAFKSLKNEQKNQILVSLGQKILQEAYFIECAGMAYAAKMNISSKTKEEREFFCFVAEEEAKHLRMIESLANFNTSLEKIPSFALLIGEIIQEASKPCHLLLIQILLEGWGLNYYKSLAKCAKDENVSNAFKAIIKDEIRHHSAGVILFSTHKNTIGMKPDEVTEFLAYLERIAFMVKIGPYNTCEETFSLKTNTCKEDLRAFLEQSQAVSVTAGKMELLAQLLSKSLPDDVLKTIKDKKMLDALDLDQMTSALFSSMPGIFGQE